MANTQGADGAAEQVPSLWTTPELFRVFGVEPMMGRVFTDREGFGRAAIRGEAAGTSVVLLSHGYWQRRFGSDPNVLCKMIPIGRGSSVVIGVMPAGFRVGTLNVDVYSPIYIDRSKPEAIGSRGFLCFGRLRPGVTLETVRAEMAVIAGQVGRDDPGEKDFGVVITSLRDYLVRDARLVLLVLAGVVGFVLLIACANLAGLCLRAVSAVKVRWRSALHWARAADGCSSSYWLRACSCPQSEALSASCSVRGPAAHSCSWRATPWRSVK